MPESKIQQHVCKLIIIQNNVIYNIFISLIKTILTVEFEASQQHDNVSELVEYLVQLQNKTRLKSKQLEKERQQITE